MDKIIRESELYQPDIDRLIAEVEAAPNSVYTDHEKIYGSARELVSNFGVHFRDKHGRQTVKDYVIQGLFVIMERKWKELGGEGDFPKPDQPGDWSI